MYKVFFNENQIIISETPIDSPLSDVFKSIQNPSKNQLLEAFQDLDPEGATVLNFWGRKDTIWNSFKEHFKWIEAAGGWVLNAKAEVLLIYRLKKWDLPKGKIEKGEEVKEAAIREVEEETGLGELDILNELPTSYHMYPRKGKMYLKKTHWFSMTCADSSVPVPQVEEDIEEVKWVPKDELVAYKSNTYPAIAELMEEQMR